MMNRFQLDIIRSDDAINKHKISFEMFKRILTSYCEAQILARKLQSNGQNKQEEYA